MNRFWRIRNGLSRLRLASARFLRLLKEEIQTAIVDAGRYIAIKIGLHAQGKKVASKIYLIPPKQTSCGEIAEQKTAHLSLKDSPGNQEKTVIFASVCVDRNDKGDWRYCGGIKELNILVKLLRLRGYEAYMVTYDGTYEPWLIDHQPHISINDLQGKLSQLKDVRCVTSWAIAKSFIDACEQVYFWDMELCVTEHSHFPALAKLYRNKMKNVAAISRTIQAWYMANFEKKCTVIPNLLDMSLWQPLESSRLVGRVGYMDEGPHTAEYIAAVQVQIRKQGIEAEFYLIRGNEDDVLSGMQSCEVFLSMNIGKDPLWGEGCPRTTIEALSVGCVVIAFDLVGNRETLLDGFNGTIVERFRPDLMADALVDLFQMPEKMVHMRTNGLSLISACHTYEKRWPAIKEFLDL